MASTHGGKDRRQGAADGNAAGLRDVGARQWLVARALRVVARRVDTVHDHTSWGIYACLAGHLGEERYARLDDESASGIAHLRSDWRAVWRPGQQSELLPYSGGIHRVHNAGVTPAVSLHLYGPQGQLDGRDYDPRRDFVCDRPLPAA